MLGILFERIGSALSLAPNILPIFEQLGLYEELMAISHTCQSVDTFDPEIKKIGSIHFGAFKEIPKLYEPLLSKIPAHKIHFIKKVVRSEEKASRVTAYCADGTSYEAD
ncbi:hypothetical protein BGZ76_011448 [Entomortierella beljakovae]|nr:hypothetical protein BGZ76_011448 [Entomortierella beljakovae]